MPETSTKPYLLRAIYEWCTDNGYTPYLAVAVDARTRVPREFVKNGEIVLNISFTATSNLKMENDFVFFSARFGGRSQEIVVPVSNVLALYARENGQGMAFELEPISEDAAHEKGVESEERPDRPTAPVLSAVPTVEESDQVPPEEPPPPTAGKRPTLTRIK